MNWTCKACITVPKLIDVVPYIEPVSKTSFYLGYQQARNRIVIAFMGSEYFENWIHNLDFTKVPFPSCEASGCQIHRGFYTAYLSVRSKLIAELTKLTMKYPGAGIHLTGHSLGGALVNVCLLDLQSQSFHVTWFKNKRENNGDCHHSNTDLPDFSLGFTVESTSPTMDLINLQNFKFSSNLNVDFESESLTISFAEKLSYPQITLGAPRVGDPLLSKFLRDSNQKNPGDPSSILRIINEKDPIVHVPFTWLGFNHASREIFYTNSFSKYVECSTSNLEDPICAASQVWTTLEQLKDRMEFHDEYFNHEMNPDDC